MIILLTTWKSLSKRFKSNAKTRPYLEMSKMRNVYTHTPGWNPTSPVPDLFCYKRIHICRIQEGRIQTRWRGKEKVNKKQYKIDGLSIIIGVLFFGFCIGMLQKQAHQPETRSALTTNGNIFTSNGNFVFTSNGNFTTNGNFIQKWRCVQGCTGNLTEAKTSNWTRYRIRLIFFLRLSYPISCLLLYHRLWYHPNIL